MKVRVIYKPDKSVVIIHPAPKSRRQNESITAWQNRVFTKAVAGTDLEGLPFVDIDDSKLPDRKDRDAWEGEYGKGIKINQDKVKVKKDLEDRKALIKAEKERLLEKMAIENLKGQGLIT